MSATVLTFARCARSAARCRHSLRTLATEAVDSSTSSSSPAPFFDVLPEDIQDTRKTSRGRTRTYTSTKSVYVRSWDPISNMAEFFAMLRGVEKRFGTVREFRLLRDLDIPTTYQSYFIVEFIDDTALRQIPEKGTNLKVEIPVTRDQPGGIGLSDLSGLLQSQERDWMLDNSGLYGATVPVLPPTSGQESRPTRIVELVVQHAKKDLRNKYERPLTRQHMFFGAAFHRWGGFYQPSSDDDKPIPPRMKWVLARWEAVAKREHERRQPRQQQQQPTEAPDVAVDAQEAEAFVAQEAAQVQSEEVRAAPDTHKEQVPEPAMELAPPQSTDAGGETLSHATEQPEPQATPTQPPRLSRKQKILARAREHARAPLPDAEKRAEEEARRREEDQEPPEAEVSSMRERLLKLMGRWS